MLEIAGPVLDALARGQGLAIATVTRVLGSAPRTLGTSMAVTDTGAVIGSISGGCVEGDLYEAAAEVLADGRGRVAEYGVSDDDAFAAGLSCGGTIEVYLTELAPAGHRNAVPAAVLGQLRAAAAGLAAGLAVVVAGPGTGLVLTPQDDEPAAAPVPAASVPAASVPAASVGLDADSNRRIRAELRARLAGGRTALGTVDCAGLEARVLFLVAAAPPRFLIFGAGDFASALSAAASLLGYRVTVCDARAVFATPERFPTADEVVVAWPSDYLAGTDTDARTVICVLSHDEKFDLPLLQAALRLDVAYVGAMGSRRTHDRRMHRLQDAGLSGAELDRLHSPIGLDLGASTPEETAVSILAEVLATRSGGSGAPLGDRTGPIHRPAASPGSDDETSHPAQ
ncbi:XdhC family protein [Cryobacterium sp.]|uniref:XdhC family protein n=1 Tax=Cryobacterium sp. TaxID=1926290 RepID=UPI00261608B9|nr:XdhC/CoxI family protein [Cryobacterium sp.]MCU1445076.1 XshC-Cox1-family protein [Cryobacterium sp.]